MVISKLWVFFLSLLSLAKITGSTQSECHIDMIDVIAGETFIIGTWSLNNATLSITVKRGDNIRFSFLFDGWYGWDHKSLPDEKGRLLLKQNNITREVSLVFDKVGREDEGQYTMQESFQKDQRDKYGREDGEWIFQLNVIEQVDEVPGFVGDKIVRDLNTTTESFFLYRYDKTIATVTNSGCWVSQDSTVYGRLRCDSKNDGYTISIQNVKQRDTGLYKIQHPMNSSSIQRWFFNISDKPIKSRIGDNVVIGWFYNQHGINCKIRVIHPYEGVMMLVPSTNVPEIKSNFQNRLLYNGNVSEHYMSFTLLNVITSDAGFYIIETIHETTIPGSKQLIVEANINRSGRNNETIGTSLTDVPLHHASSDLHESQKVTSAAVSEISSELDTSTEGTHASESGSLNIPFIGIPVVIGVVFVILLMIGCLIRIQQKNTHSLEAVQRLVLEKCDTASFATPSTIRRRLPTPPSEEETTGHLIQQPNSDRIGIVGPHYAAIPKDQLRVETVCSGIISLEKMEYDKPRIQFTEGIENCGKSSQTSNKTVSDAEHNCSLLVAGTSRKQKEPNTCAKYLYAEVKKSPRFASDTKRTSNPHKNSVHGTSEEGGYEMFESMINIISEEAIKISDDGDALLIKEEGSKEEEMTPDIDNNDYQDINLQ